MEGGKICNEKEKTCKQFRKVNSIIGKQKKRKQKR